MTTSKLWKLRILGEPLKLVPPFLKFESCQATFMNTRVTNFYFVAILILRQGEPPASDSSLISVTGA